MIDDSSKKSGMHAANPVVAAMAMVGFVGVLMFAGGAVAQGADSAAVTSPTGNPYKSCVDGTSNEDRTTCMKEAGAAQAEARRGQLSSPGSATEQNALQRCEVLPGDQRDACRLRIQGAGSVSGSVAGGGVIREVTVQQPAAETTSGSSTTMPAAPDAK